MRKRINKTQYQMFLAFMMGGLTVYLSGILIETGWFIPLIIMWVVWLLGFIRNIFFRTESNM